MKKNYWWRSVTLLVSFLGIITGEITFYPYKYNLCSPGMNCIFNHLRKSVAEPLFIYSIALLVISVLLFFIKDGVFIRWFKFALIYTVFAWFIIIITPVSPGGFLDPDREQVSIWMSALFLIISLILIVIWQIKEKRKSK